MSSMLVIRPPMTAIASGCCICAPGPSPIASGTRPRMVQRLVIRIGRNRVRPALSKASWSGIPWSRNWPMYSIKMIPFFTSRPISRMAPMNDETFSGVPVTQRAKSALASDTGWARKMRIGSDKLWNWNPRRRKTSAAETMRTVSRLANDLLLRPVVPCELPAVAPRELEAPRAPTGALGSRSPHRACRAARSP